MAVDEVPLFGVNNDDVESMDYESEVTEESDYWDEGMYLPNIDDDNLYFPYGIPQTPSMEASPPSRLSDKQASLIRLYGDPETIEAVEHSDDHLHEPKIACSICTVPYHTEYEPGMVEHPFITACGHILGAACLRRCLREDPRCPICRFRLVFDCGHTIQPRPAFRLPDILKLQITPRIPAACLTCQTKPVHAYWRAKIEEYEAEKIYLQKKLNCLMAFIRKDLMLTGPMDDRTCQGLVDEVERDIEEILMKKDDARGSWRVDVLAIKEKAGETWAAAL